jgi:two-component system cell cycle sensor histidine kinase PleC
LEKTIQVSELKSNIITMAAHELKTPLTSIFGWADLLYAAKKQGKSLDENFELEDIESILRNADRLNNLINDFLDVGRIESGQLETSRQHVNFSEIAENAIEAVEYLATQKGIILISELEADIAVTVNRRRMEQVIINLLSNAIKYSPENTHVTISNNRTEVDGSPMLRVQVIDEGYGFTPEELADALQPFGKAFTQQEQKRAVQGTGLGLFISNRIVEEHGGKLTMNSAGPNQGTVAEILLPIDN